MNTAVFVYPEARSMSWGTADGSSIPEHTFYGAKQFARRDWHILAPEHASFALARGMAGLGLATRGVLGRDFDLSWALRSLRMARTADIVVTTSVGIGLGIALLKHLGLLDRPLVVVAGGYKGRPRPRFRWLEEACYSAAGREVDRLVVITSELECTQLAAELGIPRDRCAVIPFGIDTRFHYPASDAQREYFVSVGHDRRRDYDTLFRAAEQLRWPVKVVAPWKQVKSRSIPTNVQLIPRTTFDRARELLQHAIAAIITTRPGYYLSGNTTALHAMACATPVIITGGADATAAGFRDGVNCLHAGAQDALSVVRHAQTLVDDPQIYGHLVTGGLRTVREWNVDKFGFALEELTRRVLDGDTGRGRVRSRQGNVA